MRIELEKVGKRYQNDWVLRNIQLQLEENKPYALTGPNGSGKSTFLKILSGHLSPSKGKITHHHDGQAVDLNTLYQFISYAAPYIDLIEELTLVEAIKFHQNFKSLQKDLSTSQLIELLGFKKSKNKQIKYFSSGMKQRLKLALSICSKSPLLLLDEPSTNLDKQGIDWYLSLIKDYAQNRLVVVASNVEVDYQFCKDVIPISQFK